jgi:predicted transcriptional regulator
MPATDLHLVNVRLSDEARAQLRALADDEERTVTSWIRHVIRQRYEARFGEGAHATKGGRR